MKLILNVIILLIFSLFFSGCAKNENVNQISFSTWGSQSEIKILKPIIKKFEDENNIKVKLIHIPQNYFQKLHLLFASKQAPDVIFINNYYLPLYQKANLLLDLTPYFESEITNNTYFENSIKSLSINGDLYALPRDISNMVIYYNKDVFKKCKVKQPDENWTYNEFLNISKKLTSNSHWALGYEENPLFWEPILWSYGGELFNKQKAFNLNKKESLDALKFYIELGTKYNVMPSKRDSTNQTMAQMFLNQKIVMHISGRWLVPKYREEANFDWDILPLPNGPKGSISGSDTSGWAISKQTKKIELALKFIKYLDSKEVLEKITNSGLITPAKKEIAYSKYFLNNEKPKNAKVFININYNARINTIPENYNQKIEKLTKILEPYFLGEKIISPDTKFEL